MDEVKLPECNPQKTCERCGAELPMFAIRKGVLDGKPYLAENFCPASAGKNNIVILCMSCKTKDNVARREKK